MILPHTRHHLPAFSFIEVLFAVILLGLGFIMIAGVFPAAIQQTAAASSETQGNALIRDAIKKIQTAADSQIPGSNATNTLFPATPFVPVGNTSYPTIQAFSTTPNANGATLAQLIGNDGFYSADHRFAWVGFYRRDLATNPFAQVFIVALQNPNFPNYTSPLLTGNSTAVTTSTISQIDPLVPPPIPPNTYNAAALAGTNAATIQASFYYYADGTTGVYLVYPNFSNLTPPPPGNGANGAYLLIAGPNLALGSGPPMNMIGRFFRVGTAQTVPSSIVKPTSQSYQYFLLQPGLDLTTSDLAAANPAYTPNPPGTMSPTIAFGADVWLIGAAPILNSPPANSSDYTGPFTGPDQDIAAASGFIRVNTTNN